MRRPDGWRLRRLVGWGTVLAAAALIAAAVPATSSAFTASITNSANSAASKAVFTCADVFAGDGRSKSAFFEYTLLQRSDERAGSTTVIDSSPRGNTGTYDGTLARDTTSPRPCPADPGAPYALDGTSSRVLTSKYFDPIRGDFSIEVWFKTSVPSEKIMGFEGSQSGVSNNYDKHLYVDGDGLLRFAIYNGNGDTSTATSTARVDDGLWHQAVATSSSTAGCVLYVDGAVVGTNPKTVAEDFGGYWRIGEGKTESWPGAPAVSHFNGSLAFAGAYGTVLSAAAVRSAYDIGKPGSVSTPTPTPTPQSSVVATTAPTATPSATPSQATATASPGPEQTAIAVSPTQDPDISTTPGGAAPSQ